MKLFWVSSLCMSPGFGSYILPATQLRGGEGGERHGETVHVQMLNGHRLKELLVIFKSKSTYDVEPLHSTWRARWRLPQTLITSMYFQWTQSVFISTHQFVGRCTSTVISVRVQYTSFFLLLTHTVSVWLTVWVHTPPGVKRAALRTTVWDLIHKSEQESDCGQEVMKS